MTTTPSPVSEIDEAEVAFLKGEPLPEAEPPKGTLVLEAVLWVLGASSVYLAWVAVVTLALIFGDE